MVYQLQHVSVRYQEQDALRDTHCTIEAGKWISVIGQTGAGKSTLVQVLKGLIPVIQGEYLIDYQAVSRDARGRLQVRPEIGYVFQYPEHQLFEITVARELAFAPRQQGWSTSHIQQKIAEILPQIGLSEDVLELAPFQLSGGQKRRVALASILMMDPQVLIVDEPTAGLDPIGRATLLQYLHQWQQQNNRTLILVSHHLDDVAQYSDEIILMHQGVLIGQYDPVTLLIEQSHLLEQHGLILPESIQLLQLIEQCYGQKIEVDSCREEDIFARILPIWHRKEQSYD
ncbi:ATP-binding cassette domain-containing protein [Paenibacillus kyungheensis]|uniref:ATP-binding cassette domain-containing protein n=1 Tax=Paenibacillus kyungheensis TaxID=1452732 RepID=A0AAX3M2U8_9BACL|nr:ATP-binding cassette domain-containing protein [Paenibacillus kyungheensis]WCT56471.1 ATP-binding cassette domain-containing protein [Paenibacillus kyungheensis]